eukprot:GFUD01048919.1.p1 GENE.GFUD01048919.1~~GFUD01048919.1.p1  ORF type:complete len:242 (+),score=80.68 GFUD01048919.1:48-728(+)
MGSLCEKINNDEKEEGEIDDNDNKVEASNVPALVKNPQLKTYQKQSATHNPQPVHLIPGESSRQPAHRKIVSFGTSNMVDLQAQIDLDSNPVRLNWLHQLLDFMAARGTPITYSPTIPTAVNHCPESSTTKQPLDLHSLYQNTRAQAGGLTSCTESKGWKAVAVRMNVPLQKAFVLRHTYEHFLFPLEEFESKQERKALLPTPGTAGLQETSREEVSQDSGASMAR